MSETIYRRIGGRDAVETVVNDFYDRVLADERLVGYFEGMEMEQLRAHQVQFVSSVAGGPVEYSGENMREAHAHLDITEADFDAVGVHLERALRENGVGDDDVESIMDEVVALKDPILGRT
ncbi:globin [Haloprofundus marisrubri]|uniref:Globin n=1 Tax=Haloprofundus marisrubri TaxID=1514971 RepID=A0A0W1R466_9EURY|nr:group 1 truncated hemoglobin [Haloprofundus marisrubri]KTG07647.1 globin [Haloprofundus marisrubri]